LIVGIVGLRYLRSRDKRENGIVRAALCISRGHHTRPHRFGLVAPALLCPENFRALCFARDFHAQNEIAPSASFAKALFPFQMAALPLNNVAATQV
jgi:hypothetical protein